MLEAARPLELEVLFPGNLPVWANLWLPAYVRRVALTQGPVALIQLQYKSCSVQVFGGNADQVDVPETSRNRISDLSGWIAGNLARVVIVPRSIDDDEAILETELPITIMTGADEAAKIEAYRRSKELVEAARRAELQSPALSLVIAGTDEGTARVIAGRIAETANRFLKFDLPLELVIPAMGPTSEAEPTVTAGPTLDVPVGPTYDTERLVAELRRAALDRGSAGPGPLAQLPLVESRPVAEAEGGAARSAVPSAEQLLASLDDDPDLPTRSVESVESMDSASSHELAGLVGTERSATESESAAPDLDSPDLDSPDPESPGLDEPFDEESERIALRSKFESVSAPAMATLPESEPRQDPAVPVEAQEPAAAATHAIPDHAALIPGLEVVDLPCPVSPRISLALDDRMRLHLVAEEASLRDLRAAEVWAIRNRSLLVAVFSDELAPFEDRGLRLDLVVHDAAGASDLHGTGLLLHLLVETTESERFTIPLNNEKTAFITP